MKGKTIGILSAAATECSQQNYFNQWISFSEPALFLILFTSAHCLIAAHVYVNGGVRVSVCLCVRLMWSVCTFAKSVIGARCKDHKRLYSDSFDFVSLSPCVSVRGRSL